MRRFYARRREGSHGFAALRFAPVHGLEAIVMLDAVALLLGIRHAFTRAVDVRAPLVVTMSARPGSLIRYAHPIGAAFGSLSPFGRLFARVGTNRATGLGVP